MKRSVTLFAILATCAAVSAGNIILPDLRTGNVNGLTGLLYWPAELPAANGDPRPLPSADGCEVHLVPQKDLEKELRYPCGKWFVLPAADRYNYWLETSGRMTPSPSVVIYAEKPFEGRGAGGIIPVTPAGSVAVPSERTIADTESLRLISVEARDAWGRRIFDRRVASRDVRKPTQMPEGRVVAGRFDRRTSDAIALSRPIDVRSGKTAFVWPAPPAESDVLVVLSKSPALQLAKPFTARLTLDVGSAKHAPDVMINGFDRIIAIWYGVAARRATIVFQSDAAFRAPQEISLTRGRVTTVRSSVERLPKITAAINVPPDAALPEELSLDMRRPGTNDSLRHLAVRPGVHEIEALPAEQLRATLNIGPWKMSEDIDLSSGNDATVTFDVQPISVEGTVYFGDEPARAQVAFFNGEEWPSVRTNERGEYHTTFWWPKVHAARITIADRNLPPYTEGFVEIFESGKVDFHVPRTDYAVHIRDAVTRSGIAGARVTAGNIWTGSDARERQAAQHVTTDDSGVAVLPPLQKGELIVDVHTEHYAAREPLRVQVDDQHHELEIELQPLRAAASIHLLMPNGSPAAHAEVWAFDDAMQPLWRGSCDANGVIEVPDLAANASLLIRHASAASTIRRIRASEEAITWTLDTPAEPLTMVSEETRSTMVVLWLDGMRLSGPPLAFAAWSTSATNPNGVWVGRNLPPKPLRMLVLPPSAIASNAWDAVAGRIDYPWPARVTAPKF